ncbi:MAG: metallophosphoesterase [Methanomicrobiaceae archaeon]|nr:metallophosphoesterase [Methanomicrobiaceae archaeon]
MKIVHIADTHLGLAGFSSIDPESGMNLREKKIYDNFLESMKIIVGQRPDAVVHAGDLFDRVKPRTHAYITVLSALDMLEEADIPLILISGNHSMPKTRYTPSPFKVLEYHKAKVHCAYRYKYEIEDIDDTTFHLIPNMLKASDYRDAFNEIEIARNTANVMVTHGLATTLRDYRLRTVAEHEIDSTMLSEDFSYIALGHFHGQKQVAENAWYSGSIEYCTYNEINDKKGGLIVNTESGEAIPLELPNTPMIDLGRIDCNTLTPSEITEKIQSVIDRLKDPGDSLCQIRLENILREKIRNINRDEMAEIKNRVFNLRIASDTIEPVKRGFETEDPSSVDYVDEFRKFVKIQGLEGALEEEIISTGSNIFKNVIDKHREAD